MVEAGVDELLQDAVRSLQVLRRRIAPGRSMSPRQQMLLGALGVALDAAVGVAQEALVKAAAADQSERQEVYAKIARLCLTLVPFSEPELQRVLPTLCGDEPQPGHGSQFVGDEQVLSALRSVLVGVNVTYARKPLPGEIYRRSVEVTYWSDGGDVRAREMSDDVRFEFLPDEARQFMIRSGSDEAAFTLYGSTH
jgi:hypothetical protein